MAPSLRSTLVKVGVIEDIRPGQPRKYVGEEGAKLKRANEILNQRLQRQLKKEAAERGEPPPIFKRGRPRKYETDEEAKIAKEQQSKVCQERLHARLEAGVQKLKELLEKAHASPRSNDE